MSRQVVHRTDLHLSTCLSQNEVVYVKAGKYTDALLDSQREGLDMATVLTLYDLFSHSESRLLLQFITRSDTGIIMCMQGLLAQALYVYLASDTPTTHKVIK